MLIKVAKPRHPVSDPPHLAPLRSKTSPAPAFAEAGEQIPLLIMTP